MLIYGEELYQTLDSFDRALQKLIGTGLKCKPRKCKILPEKLEFLGHILSEHGITADSSKIDRIREWPFPKTKTEMQSFLRLCNYYRRLVPEFGDSAKPLYTATAEPKIVETPELRQVFEILREKLCSIPVVRLPNPNKPFILITDASNYAVGAELRQVEGPDEYPVLWFSKALTSSQVNYSTYERELLAVVLACENFSVFLLGRDFVLRTDHRALIGIFTSKIANSSRIAKWLLKLQPYRFEIQVIKGKDNVVADALSRIPWPITVIDSQAKDLGQNRLFVLHQSTLERTSTEEEVTLLDLKVVALEQDKDLDILKIKNWVQTNYEPIKKEFYLGSPHVKTFIPLLSNLKVVEGLLVWKECAGRERIIVPAQIVDNLVRLAHSAEPMTHEGSEKIIARLALFFFWPQMKRDIKRFVVS